MTSLIITIIAIALVAALAVATIYYGGSVQSEASENAKVATVLNHTQQIQGAATLYTSDTGTAPADLATLINKSYLKAAPADVWLSQAGFAIREESSDVVCRKVNKDLGINGIPTCDDPTYATVPVCCIQATATAPK